MSTGAGERSRTPDLLITNELLYQLSYTGEVENYSEVFWLISAFRQCRRTVLAVLRVDV